MSPKVRGIGRHHSPRSIGTASIAILATTAACGGAAFLGAAIASQPLVDPIYAAAAGFIAAGSVCALRWRRSRGMSAKPREAAPDAIAPDRTALEAPLSAAGDHRTPVDISDLAEAIAHARISRILLPFGSGGGAVEALALARRLAAEGASTIFVDLGARGVARETGLIDPPSDAVIIAASPTTFAHSIHRDRSSRAHVLSASIDPQAGDRVAMSDAVATVLDALGEAYGRTVVAFPADRLHGVETLIHADTAVVAPASSLGDAAITALLDDLDRRGIEDVLLVASKAESRRSAVA